MKKISIGIAILATAFRLTGSAPEEIPAAKQWNDPARFARSSTGEMVIFKGETENSVRFDVSFKPGSKNNWCYPQMKLKKDEEIPAGTVLQFDFKAEAPDGELKCDYVLLILNPGNIRCRLPVPKKEWQTVTIDLSKLTEKPEAVRQFTIGMNPRNEKISYQIRNIRLLDRIPPKTDKELQAMISAWNTPARFAKSSSGAMNISQDKAENAVRFDVSFKPGSKNNWCYPQMKLKKDEEIPAGTMLQFDFKAENKSGKLECDYVLLILNPGNIRHTLPIPGKQWQTVTVDLSKLTEKPEAVRQFTIGMNPRNPEITYWIRNIRLLNKKAVRKTFSATAPGAAYIQGEALNFNILSEAKRPLNWTLSDWHGNKLQSGVAAKEQAVLTVASLPCGYYRLHLQDENGMTENACTFAVVPDPAKRVRNPETYFAIDSAQSLFGEKSAEELTEIIARAGLDIIRDRLSWKRVNPRKGKYDWNRYMLNARLLQEKGIAVCNTYHDAPNWTKKYSRTLPDDLLDCYRFAEKATQAFQGKVTAWEFWNEEDIQFCMESAWDYAAAMKAAYLGFKAGNRKIPVALGSFSNPRLPNYCHVILQNGVRDYFDIFNVHIYEALKDYPELMAGICKYQEQHQFPERPLWLTENGCRMEGFGASESGKPGVKAHSPEQELVVAEFLAKSMMTLQAMGAKRNFFFSLIPHREDEGRKDWGLLRLDFTVKPAYAAFVNMKHQLDHAQVAGTFSPAEGVQAIVYIQPDGSQTLVYWSLSEIDKGENRYFNNGHPFGDLAERPFSISVPDATFCGTDVFGTPFEQKAAGGVLQLKATRMPAYLNGLRGLTPRRTAAVSAKTAGTPQTTAHDRTVIFRTVLSDDFELSVTKDCVDVKKDGAAWKLQVWNLSDQPKDGIVSIGGCAVSGLPGKVTVAPFGMTELPLTLNSPAIGTMKISGKFNGKDVSSLVMPMTNMRKMIASGKAAVFKGMDQPERWRANSSGKMKITYDNAEKAIRFETVFPPTVSDFWTYPEFRLLDTESFKNVYGIAFELKVDQPEKVSQMVLMQVSHTQKEHGSYVGRKFTVPKTSGWEERIVTLDTTSSSTDGIRMLRIGLNTSASEITCWLRNVKIIYKH